MRNYSAILSLYLRGGIVMERKPRPISKIDDDIKSAGQTFIGIRMEDMLTRIPELEDRNKKNKLIEEYYENQIGTQDSECEGTRTRVNAVMRIIQSDNVLYALKRINGSDSRVLSEAVTKAKNTIKKIKSGELKLPNLE